MMMRQHQPNSTRRAETATAIDIGSAQAAGAAPAMTGPGDGGGAANPPRPSLLGAVVQRAVGKRRGTDTEQWYTDRDPDRSFDTAEEAREHQRQIDADEAEQKRRKKKEERAEEVAKRKLKFAAKFKELDAIESSKARLFKEKGKDYDDVPFTTLDASNAKTFMEGQMALRRTDAFKTHVIKLGGHNFVMDPGTDIGITPAVYEPELFKKGGGLPTMSRDGKAKPYNDIAEGLDNIAKRNVEKLGKTPDAVRSRMGKDLDRFTRGNEPKGELDYNDVDRERMMELAAVLRLDKARVENATKYIRKTFTTGDTSFQDLLVKKKYVGAGSGGVAKLRKVATTDGYESEGSDIEEPKPRKKRKADDAASEPSKKPKPNKAGKRKGF